jgi:Cdc6-like AAA superfamily ATPase
METTKHILLPKPRYFLSKSNIKFTVYSEGQLQEVLAKKLKEVDKTYQATPAINPPSEEKRIG